MSQMVKQVTVVERATPAPNQVMERVAFFNPDGTPYELAGVDGSEVNLTGYTIGAAGALAATDTVNEAFGKVEDRLVDLEAHDSAAEMVLTGYTIGAAGALAATDTLNGAFGKVEDRLVDLEALDSFVQMPLQANSTAANVADLVTDFNALLTKLKTAGLMASA